MKNKINLYFYYPSRNVLWSIFLILKEEKIFPKLIYINDLSRSHFEENKKFKKILIKFLFKVLFKFLFIKQISIKNKKNVDFNQIENIILKKIFDIYENNVSWFYKSLFISSIRKIPKQTIKNLISCYLKGKAIGLLSKNETNYIYNGRKKEVFMFFEGLKINSTVKRIEVTFKDGKAHIYSTKGYMWKVEDIINIESNYSFKKDISFFDRRIKGLDLDGKKFVRKDVIKDKYQKFDVAMFLSTPYEFIGFTHTSRESLNLLKNSFREIIKINNMGYKCIIRNHPNFESSHYLDKKLYKRWFSILKAKGIVISDFDDKVSSYDIAKESKLIITQGSTIGGELSYRGKYVFDINKNSTPVYFNIVKPYNLDKIIYYLESDLELYNSDHKFEDFERFSSYNLGWGSKVPEFLSIGL